MTDADSLNSPAAAVCNIGASGARRRRLGGIVWAAIAVVALVALLAMHAPRGWRVWLALPVGMAAAGLLQAHEKT